MVNVSERFFSVAVTKTDVDFLFQTRNGIKQTAMFGSWKSSLVHLAAGRCH